MTDKMTPIAFEKMLDWIAEEYKTQKSVFGIPEEKFYKKTVANSITIFDSKCETPIGPAAGPHTQLAQNIIAAYLTGGRFFELKTVQILDELEFDKPCIEAEDEGYNTEWSTELSVEQAYQEYVKAWIILPILKKLFGLSGLEENGFVFNMSVGYDLKGIKTKKIDDFIEGLKDVSQSTFFQECKEILKTKIDTGIFHGISEMPEIECNISDSITLSTMHGCPPEDQEAICKYLIKEKGLNTFVKLNPTLLGYDFVRSTFDKMGYNNIILKEDSFTHDLKYDVAVQMIKRLMQFAEENKRTFGVKLSNTLPTVNEKAVLPGEEMYMSGKALYPLTINLAAKLSEEFAGKLAVSYSGGADFLNISEIYKAGIKPITMATTLLKSGGYFRFKQIAEKLNSENSPEYVLPELLKQEAEKVLMHETYAKDKDRISKKTEVKLPLTDCFIAPCKYGCPINQDIPEYIKLVGEGRHKEALEVILTKNPLPFITGNICDHNCMHKCTRTDYETSVLIREMKRIAAENGFDQITLPTASEAENNAKIAIIGAGPAGLSAGYFAAKAGLDVTIFDKSDKPGGMVQHGIPDFRIPQTAIDNDLQIIKSVGVKFELNTVENFSVVMLKEAGFKYIFIAIGAWKSYLLKTEGDKITEAIDFLLKNKKQGVSLGENVVVVGGGNTAMDAARAALRTPNTNKVTIVYRRTVDLMPADREELELAAEDGVIFQELLNPVLYNNGILKCSKMKLGKQDASGRRRPVPIENQFTEIKADNVLSAIGEYTDYDALQANGIKVNSMKNIEVNSETNETNLENVFVIGDALRGPSSVVKAIADGRKAAEAVLQKENIKTDKLFSYIPEVNSELRMQDISRAKGNINVCSDLKNEPERCLECNTVCNICTEVCPNRANVQIKVPDLLDPNQILHIDGMCNECGNCETFCPYTGAPYKDKLTLFWTYKEFIGSSNNGFFVSDENTIKLRLKNVICDLTLKDNKIESCHPHNIVTDTDGFAIIESVLSNYSYLIKEAK
jgi:putative selenate reductase